CSDHIRAPEFQRRSVTATCQPGHCEESTGSLLVGSRGRRVGEAGVECKSYAQHSMHPTDGYVPRFQAVYWRPIQTGGTTTLNRSTWFGYNPRVVLVPLLSLLGTPPHPAACELRGAVCPPPTLPLSTNSASVLSELA